MSVLWGEDLKKLSYITDIVTQISKGATHKSHKFFPVDRLHYLTQRDSSSLAKEKIIVEIYSEQEMSQCHRN